MIPKYILLREKINAEILQGTYPIASKLPTEVELAEIYKVSRSTVRQALDLLVKDGIISKHWGSGNTVIGKSDSSKKDTIMILLPDLSSQEGSLVLSDISSTLLKQGFKVEHHQTSNEFSKERGYLQLMLDDIYAGLIIEPALSALPSMNVDLMQQLLRRKTPVIFLEATPAGIYNGKEISSDSYNKGYQIARSYINTGKKDLGGIFLQDNKSSVLAYSGFVDAIRDAGLTYHDNCFLWCNSKDPVGINTRSSAFINKFLKQAYNTVETVYLDDNTINVDGIYPVFKSEIEVKSIGKAAAKSLIALIK